MMCWLYEKLHRQIDHSFIVCYILPFLIILQFVQIVLQQAIDHNLLKHHFVELYEILQLYVIKYSQLDISYKYGQQNMLSFTIQFLRKMLRIQWLITKSIKKCKQLSCFIYVASLLCLQGYGLCQKTVILEIISNKDRLLSYRVQQFKIRKIQQSICNNECQLRIIEVVYNQNSLYVLVYVPVHRNKNYALKSKTCNAIFILHSTFVAYIRVVCKLYLHG
eukprot:TRINITY_DN10254_c2_g1_i4.p2 TRINITY_DN10254_c2_g1~~TRINITY_DN10254_c2_g1_i4.p2  ORF type:complete len:220 (+),score=-13.08 TRINITY_DN10254_c2_g1_i4:1105-1764(+)